MLQLKWGDVGDGEISFRPETLKTSAARTIPLIPRVKSRLIDLRDDGVHVADYDWVFDYTSGGPPAVHLVPESLGADDDYREAARAGHSQSQACPLLPEAFSGDPPG